MMEYKILEAPTNEELEKKVNEHIQLGWKPMGGVAIVDAATAQAMVKEA